MPHGNIHYDQVRSADRHGTAGQFQMFTGTSTTSHIALFDANGNLVDGGAASTTTIVVETNTVAVGTRGTLNLIAGTNVTITGADNSINNRVDVTIAASGGGGGSGVPPWLSVTNPTSTAFTWRNQGGASVNAGANSIWLSVPAAAGDNLRGREVTASAAPFSVTAGLIPLVHNQDVNQDGIYVTDGTKLITISVSDVAHGGGNTLVVNKWTNVTTFSATAVAPGIGVGVISPIFLKIRDDGTNIIFYWSPDGTNFIQLYSEARLTFLASIAAMGFFGSSANATWPTGVLCMSFATGT